MIIITNKQGLCFSRAEQWRNWGWGANAPPGSLDVGPFLEMGPP